MNDYAAGLGLGISVGLVLYAIVCLIKRRQHNGAKEYDERQRAAQGKAAKAAMFAHMGYAAACIAFGAGWEPTWLTVPVALFFGIAVSVGVYAIYCILHDAYFEFSRSPRSTLIMLAAIAAVEFLLVGRKAVRGELLENGALDLSAAMSGACGILLLAVLITALCKLAADRRQEARDEES